MDDRRRCTAKVSDGSGRRCKKAAMLGQRTCRAHGGASPQAKRAAEVRLAALVEPAIEALTSALNSNDVRAVIRAAIAILDRCGFSPRHAVEPSDDGEPVQVNDHAVDDLSIDARRVILAIFKWEIDGGKVISPELAERFLGDLKSAGD